MDSSTSSRWSRSRRPRSESLTQFLHLFGCGVEGSVNTTDDEGVTPLHLACSIGPVEVVHALVEAGADVSAKTNSDWSCVQIAVASLQPAILKYLLKLGAEGIDVDYETADECEIPTQLLDNIQFKYDTSQSPLLNAVPYAELVKILLEHGAKLWGSGRLELNDAILGGYFDSALALFNYVSDPAGVLAADTGAGTALNRVHVIDKILDNTVLHNESAALKLLENFAKAPGGYNLNPDYTLDIAPRFPAPYSQVVHYSNANGLPTVAQYLVQRGLERLAESCVTYARYIPLGINVKYRNQEIVNAKLFRSVDGTHYMHLRYGAMQGDGIVEETLNFKRSRASIGNSDMMWRGWNTNHWRGVDDVEHFLQRCHPDPSPETPDDAPVMTSRSGDPCNGLNLKLLNIQDVLVVFEIMEAVLQSARKFDDPARARTWSTWPTKWQDSLYEPGDELEPIHILTAHGHIPLLEHMLEKIPQVNVNAVTLMGKSVLHFAVGLGNAELVRLLLGAGADMNLIWARTSNKESTSPLDIAIENGNLTICKMLLEAGCKIRGRHEVEKCVAASQFRIANLLLLTYFTSSDHADTFSLSDLPFDFKSDHFTTLSEDLKYFLIITATVFGFDVNKNSAITGNSLIHEAIIRDLPKLIKFLQETEFTSAGVSLDLPTDSGHWPIHLAIKHNRLDVFWKLLQKNPANVHRCTKGGLSPLHLAICSGRSPMLIVLIAQGANINQPLPAGGHVSGIDLPDIFEEVDMGEGYTDAAELWLKQFKPKDDGRPTVPVLISIWTPLMLAFAMRSKRMAQGLLRLMRQDQDPGQENLSLFHIAIVVGDSHLALEALGRLPPTVSLYKCTTLGLPTMQLYAHTNRVWDQLSVTLLQAVLERGYNLNYTNNQSHLLPPFLISVFSGDKLTKQALDFLLELQPPNALDVNVTYSNPQSVNCPKLESIISLALRRPSAMPRDVMPKLIESCIDLTLLRFEGYTHQSSDILFFATAAVGGINFPPTSEPTSDPLFTPRRLCRELGLPEVLANMFPVPRGPRVVENGVVPLSRQFYPICKQLNARKHIPQKLEDMARIAARKIPNLRVRMKIEQMPVPCPKRIREFIRMDEQVKQLRAEAADREADSRCEMGCGTWDCDCRENMGYGLIGPEAALREGGGRPLFVPKGEGVKFTGMTGTEPRTKP